MSSGTRSSSSSKRFRPKTAGFDAVVVSEHFHPWVDDESAAGFAFSTIGAMAQATEHIEFVTGVTTPLFRYHPGVVAQAAATLDRLSGGRFTLGVGTGENINEGPLGYEFPRYPERNARMTESLEIMRRLLDGEKLTYEGDFLPDRPGQVSTRRPSGPVPILLAAGGPKSATLAGELAQGVITSVKDPAETMEKVVEPLRNAAEGRGRPDPIVLATRWSIFADDDEEAWKATLPLAWSAGAGTARGGRPGRTQGDGRCHATGGDPRPLLTGPLRRGDHRGLPATGRAIWGPIWSPSRWPPSSSRP